MIDLRKYDNTNIYAGYFLSYSAFLTTLAEQKTVPIIPFIIDAVNWHDACWHFDDFEPYGSWEER